MATSHSGSPVEAGSGFRLWPYRSRTALLASLILLLLLILALVGLRAADALAGDRISAWLLLGVVLVSLVPVFLILLDRVAESAGTVRGPGGVKVSFASVEVKARVDFGRTTISRTSAGIPPLVSPTVQVGRSWRRFNLLLAWMSP